MAQMSCNLLDLSVKIFCNLCLTVIWMFLLNWTWGVEEN